MFIHISKYTLKSIKYIYIYIPLTQTKDKILWPVTRVIYHYRVATNTSFVFSLIYILQVQK